MNFQNYLPLSGRTSAARFNNPGISEGIIKRVSLVQSDRQLKYHFLGLTDITSRVQLASEEIQLPAIVHDQPCQHRLFNNFPSNSNFYTFGYLNSILRDLFADPFSLSEQERIPKLREWWINKRSKSKTKAIHIVFNLDESQNAQPEALGLSGATIVSAAVADALFSFNNKHFPNSSIGWLIGVNKTQRHSNWHILLFPETSSGEQIYISNNILSRVNGKLTRINFLDSLGTSYHAAIARQTIVLDGTNNPESDVNHSGLVEIGGLIAEWKSMSLTWRPNLDFGDGCLWLSSMLDQPDASQYIASVVSKLDDLCTWRPAEPDQIKAELPMMNNLIRKEDRRLDSMRREREQIESGFKDWNSSRNRYLTIEYARGELWMSPSATRSFLNDSLPTEVKRDDRYESRYQNRPDPIAADSNRPGATQCRLRS